MPTPSTLPPLFEASHATLLERSGWIVTVARALSAPGVLGIVGGISTELRGLAGPAPDTVYTSLFVMMGSACLFAVGLFTLGLR